MQALGRSRRAVVLRPSFEEHVFDLPSSLFDLLPTAAYVCDIDGKIVRYNRRAAALWGREPTLDDTGDRFAAPIVSMPSTAARSPPAILQWPRSWRAALPCDIARLS